MFSGGRNLIGRAKISLLLVISCLLWLHLAFHSSEDTPENVVIEAKDSLVLNDISDEEHKAIEDLPLVKRVDDWSEAAGQSLRFAQWNHPSEADKSYLTSWVDLLHTLLPPSCNIVDVGAHGGDTALPLAVASRGGTVVALEMGPPVNLLRVNRRLNPGIKLDVFNLAVSDKAGNVSYRSGCGGCNGGIGAGRIGKDMEVQVESVRLHPFLSSHYSQQWLDNLCLIKLDTEGHDQVILSDLAKSDLRPPFIWTEWFASYKFGGPNHCSKRSAKLFKTSTSMGYQIFQPTLPLKTVPGCQNRHYQRDLLLIHKSRVSSGMGFRHVLNNVSV